MPLAPRQGLETIPRPREVAHTGGDAGRGFRQTFRCHAHFLGRARQHLHQPAGAGERHLRGVEAALLVHLRHQEAPIEAMFLGGGANEAVVGR